MNGSQKICKAAWCSDAGRSDGPSFLGSRSGVQLKTLKVEEVATMLS